MKIWVLSLHFKNASLEERAQASLQDREQIRKISSGLQECVWIMTCNRLEVYAVGSVSPEEILSRWAQVTQLSETAKDKFQIYHGLQALLHLFRVTASLESMVLGENQIHGQVKKSYLQAQEDSSLGSILHRCFQSAFRAAKRVRSETEVGQFAVSVPSIGVKLAQKVVGKFGDKCVGILGLGEIGRLAAEHFGSVGPKQVLLYNRTHSVAEEIAKQLKLEGVSAEAVGSLESVLEKSQILVSCVNTLLLKELDLKRLEARAEPPFILDLSAPPSVEAYESDRLLVYSIDDLKRIADENSQLRQQELDRAGKIVFEEAEKTWRSLETTSLSQTFELLAEKVSSIRQKELQILRKKLPDLSEADWAEIEKMSERLGQKLIQDPVTVLRSQAEDQGETETWLHFFKNMFRI